MATENLTLIRCQTDNMGHMDRGSPCSASSLHSSSPVAIDPTVQALQLKFPRASCYECERFYEAFGSDEATASKRLSALMEWKETHGLFDIVADATEPVTSVWNRAINHAAKHHGFETDRSANTAPGESVLIPEDQLLFCPFDSNGKPYECSSGNIIVCCMPARMDLNRLDKNVAATAAALCANHILTAFPGRKITVVMDCRAGKGWVNAPVTQMVPMILHVTNVIAYLLPPNSFTILAMPIPSIAVSLYKSISVILPASISKSLRLVAGSGTSVDSEMPRCDCIPQEPYRRMEAVRASMFVQDE